MTSSRELSRRSTLRVLGAGSAGAAALALATAAPARAATPFDPAAGPGCVFFDTHFTGADDDAKLRQLNAWMAQQAPGTPIPAVVFDSRVHTFTTAQIELRSGMTLIGGKRSTAREYNTGTVFQYNGTGAMTRFVTDNAVSIDGGPVNLSFRGIQFVGKWVAPAAVGPADPWYDPRRPAAIYSKYPTDFIEITDFNTTNLAHVLWYSEFHDCGWTGFNTIWWGFGDGVSFSGSTHINAMSNAAFRIAGSECSIFGNDGFSFADSSQDTHVPFLISRLAKSTIGKVMITAQGRACQLQIDGGGALTVNQLYVDAHDDFPVYGPPVIITGGDGIVLTNMSFKGGMSNPAAAFQYTNGNKGWINMSGGRQLVVQNCSFVLGDLGNDADATAAQLAVPLLYTGPAVGPGQVRWGWNAYVGNVDPRGRQVRLNQSAADQIQLSPDANVTVVTAP